MALTLCWLLISCAPLTEPALAGTAGQPYLGLRGPSRFCFVYEEIAAFRGHGRTYQAQPQSWALRVEPALLHGTTTLDVGLDPARRGHQAINPRRRRCS
jgi:hypothetical protein